MAPVSFMSGDRARMASLSVSGDSLCADVHHYLYQDLLRCDVTPRLLLTLVDVRTKRLPITVSLATHRLCMAIFSVTHVFALTVFALVRKWFRIPASLQSDFEHGAVRAFWQRQFLSVAARMKTRTPQCDFCHCSCKAVPRSKRANEKLQVISGETSRPAGETSRPAERDICFH